MGYQECSFFRQKLLGARIRYTLHTLQLIVLKQATAEKIAESALRILEKEGPPAVTMRPIAKTVGITPMAVYRYFPGREVPLKEITDRDFAKRSDLFELGRRPADAQLMRVMDKYLDYSFAHLRIFDYVFSQYRNDAQRYPDDFHTRASRSPKNNLGASTGAR